jgi:small-conductance mechanosensitive channel
MPSMGSMADMGKGNPYLVNPEIRMNSIERLTVLLIRLVAWLALVILVITLCGDTITAFSVGTGSFNALVNIFVGLLKELVAGAVTAVLLLGFASVVESLITMRHNRS